MSTLWSCNSLNSIYSIYLWLISKMNDKKSFSIDDYEYSPYLLSSSRDSKVYKAVNQHINSTVVFKGYPEAVLANPLKQKRLNQQLNILWNLSGKGNILQIISQHVRDKQVFIISEYCQKGTLYDEVKRCGKLTEELAIKYIRQIINGYKSIYSVKVIHRSLEASNILIKRQELKIADFSDAILISEATLTAKREEMVGQLLYQAPQTLSNYRYSTKTDIYSIGVLFYFMLQGQLPYAGLNKKQVRQNMENDSINSKILSSWQQKTQQFLIKTLELNEDERMGIDELLNFDFGLMQHFKQMVLCNLQQEKSDYILEQSQNEYKEEESLEMDALKAFDLGISRNISNIQIKASEMDLGRSARREREREISIVIPSGVDMHTLKSIALGQQFLKKTTDQRNKIKEEHHSPVCQNEKASPENNISKRKASFHQCLAQRMQKKDGMLSKKIQNFQKLQVKIDKSISNNLISSKSYGPITARGRQNIKADIQKKSSVGENGIVTNWLLSQIDMVRLLNRVCFRLKKLQPRSQNILYKELLGLTVNILKEVQDLTLLEPSLAVPFRNSAEHNQLKEIVEVYRSRATSKQSFSSYTKLNDLLIQQIDRIYRDTINSSELSQDHVKTLDFLVTVWQLHKLLKKRDLKLFCQKSKIELIVDGQQAEVKVWHLLQLYDRMKLLKIIK